MSETTSKLSPSSAAGMERLTLVDCPPATATFASEPLAANQAVSWAGVSVAGKTYPETFATVNVWLYEPVFVSLRSMTVPAFAVSAFGENDGASVRLTERLTIPWLPPGLPMLAAGATRRAAGWAPPPTLAATTARRSPERRKARPRVLRRRASGEGGELEVMPGRGERPEGA